MNAVLDGYPDKDPQELSKLTHKERPWRENQQGIKPSEDCDSVSPKELMQEYYGGLEDTEQMFVFQVTVISHATSISRSEKQGKGRNIHRNIFTVIFVKQLKWNPGKELFSEYHQIQANPRSSCRQRAGLDCMNIPSISSRPAAGIEYGSILDSQTIQRHQRA